jgi:hypothetical protein
MAASGVSKWGGAVVVGPVELVVGAVVAVVDDVDEAAADRDPLEAVLEQPARARRSTRRPQLTDRFMGLPPPEMGGRS